MDISPQKRDLITRQANATETRKQAERDLIQFCLGWAAIGLFALAAVGTAVVYLISLTS